MSPTPDAAAAVREASRYLKRYASGVYSVRVPVPTDLQSVFGPQIEQGLATRIESEAIRRKAEALVAYAAWFDTIRVASAIDRSAMIAAKRPATFRLQLQRDSLFVHAAASLADPATDDTRAAYRSVAQIAASEAIRVHDTILTTQLDARDPAFVREQNAQRFRVSAMLGELIDTLDMTPHTAERKRNRVARFVAFAGDLPMNEFAAFRMAAIRYLKHRLASGAEYGTVRIDAVDLQQIGVHVAEVHQLANPCTGLTDRKVLGTKPADKDHCFTPAETRAMLASARADWDADHAAMLAFLVFTGCRLGDAQRFRACDYRPLTEAEAVKGHGTAGDMILDINESDGHAKKSGARHTVRLAPCHPDLAPILAAAAARNAGGRMFAKAAAGSSFYDAHAKLIGRVIGDTGARALSCHSWRHTSWTVASVAGWHREQWLDLVGKAPEMKDYKGKRLTAGTLAPMLATLALGG